MIQKEFAITSVSKVADETYLLEFFSPEISATASPGQFVNIRIDQSYFPLLRRPMSICDVEGEKVKILFNVAGRGTSMLAQKRVGETLDVLGPLGHGFKLDGDFDRAILVAGGLGVAPFPFLTRKLSESGSAVASFIGARTANRLVLEGLQNVSVSTDDGSRGFHGTVVELLQMHLTDINPSRVKLFACGPRPMLRALQDVVVESGITCEASFETTMACGIGICQGCPVECVEGNPKYKLVCKDGPVFDLRTIVV